MTRTGIRLPLLLVAMLLGIGSLGVAGGTPVETDSETGSTPQSPPSKSLDELRLSAHAPLDGGEAIFYMQGWAYGFVPGERPRKLFGIEGFNIRHFVPVEDMEGDLILASRRLGSWDELPGWIRAQLDQEYSQYRHPPEEIDVKGHNETFWTYNMKEMKRRAQVSGGS